MDLPTNIITSENLPPQISFFCSNCVTGSGVKIDVYGAPIVCKECNGQRLITKSARIDKLTPDYCMPALGFALSPVEEDIYYVLLIMGKDGFLSEMIDISEFIDTVRSARYIKDRFFFTTPLPIDVVTDVNFFTDIAWIPKR